MPRSLVLTVIGDDRPGLVGALAAVVSDHQGNWLESSMSHLAGKFAGILRVDIPEQSEQPLTEALGALPDLSVIVQSSPPVTEQPGRRFALALVGHDRIGIVREVTAVLARHAINVENLSTHTASAPMSSEPLFHADAELFASPDFDSAELQADLERISSDLMVDINLAES